MTPIEICERLGSTRIDEVYGLLSGKEVRAVLQAGGVSASTPATAFTREARLAAWHRRFEAEIARKNGELATALLLEWLLRHRRNMLVDYLNHLGVKHRQGETDDDFTKTKTADALREGARVLFAKYPAHEVAAYLLFIGHVQESGVFDQTPEVLTALGLDDAAAAAYVSAHVAQFGRAEDAAKS